MRDRVEAFIPVAGGIAFAVIILLTFSAAAILAGGALAPSASTIAASFGTNGSNAYALSVYADQSAAIATGTKPIWYVLTFALPSMASLSHVLRTWRSIGPPRLLLYLSPPQLS